MELAGLAPGLGDERGVSSRCNSDGGHSASENGVALRVCELLCDVAGEGEGTNAMNSHIRIPSSWTEDTYEHGFGVAFEAADSRSGLFVRPRHLHRRPLVTRL